MMHQEPTKKRGFCHATGEEEQQQQLVFPGKRPRTPVREEDGDLFAWLTMDDETVTELSKLLDSEAVSSTAFRVKFACDPFISPEIFQSSASYITINGNNDESCGSSFSESDSSVMASVDLGCCRFRFGGRGIPGGEAMVDGGAWENVKVARGSVEQNGSFEKTDGCDWFDCRFEIDDDVLARFGGGDFVGPHVGCDNNNI